MPDLHPCPDVAELCRLRLADINKQIDELLAEKCSLLKRLGRFDHEIVADRVDDTIALMGWRS